MYHAMLGSHSSSRDAQAACSLPTAATSAPSTELCLESSLCLCQEPQPVVLGTPNYSRGLAQAMWGSQEVFGVPSRQQGARVLVGPALPCTGAIQPPVPAVLGLLP